jgi:hypothetical protein
MPGNDRSLTKHRPINHGRQGGFGIAKLDFQHGGLM